MGAGLVYFNDRILPEAMRELIARVRAHLRRSAKSGQLSASNEVLRGGEIELDIDAHVTRVGGVQVELRPKEFELLTLLARHHDRVLTHRTILKAVWGPHAVEQPEPAILRRRDVVRGRRLSPGRAGAPWGSSGV